MKHNANHFIRYEHQSLIENEVYNGNVFTSKHHLLLENYFKEKDFPYYKLIRNGIRLCEYVGVLQIGNMIIEILPKTDKLGEDTETVWRNLLIDMLREVGVFKIHAPTNSSLKLQANSILDLYFELYLTELEYLLHRGLVKRYRKTERNTTALKGSLQFSKHIQQNLVHKERFYVSYTNYDVQHQIHAILYKALKLLKLINTKSTLHSKIGALLLNFPEMSDIKVSEATFEKIVYNRKDEHYQKAIEIARLLLLNYHPDISQGRNNVLALMFDMNLLWEQFVYISLRKKFKNYKIEEQRKEYLWKPQNGSRSYMKADIVINKGKDNCVVIDTKWKNLNGVNPSPEDLRQMYVYHEYYGAQKVALVYPNFKNDETIGHFLKPETSEIEIKKECRVILLGIPEKAELGTSLIKTWQNDICNKISGWLKE